MQGPPTSPKPPPPISPVSNRPQEAGPQRPAHCAPWQVERSLDPKTLQFGANPGEVTREWTLAPYSFGLPSPPPSISPQHLGSGVAPRGGPGPGVSGMSAKEMPQRPQAPHPRLLAPMVVPAEAVTARGQTPLLRAALALPTTGRARARKPGCGPTLPGLGQRGPQGKTFAGGDSLDRG